MDIDNSKDRGLQAQYVKNSSTFNRLNSSTPYDGTSDKFSDIRIRLAIIDNPEASRKQFESIDPFDIRNCINLNNGKVTLKWVDSPGGIIRTNHVNGEWVYKKDKDNYNPENRDFQEWSITSQREQVHLSHPFIWANSDNYCGINYIPPVGSIVMVGFRKQGLPLILGYVQSHYQICKPPLKPGEMTFKGYGNNYIHNRWSDKLDIKAWSKEGNRDLDDPEGKKTNKSSANLWIRLNANDRYIELISQESGSGSGNDNNLNKYPADVDKSSVSRIVLRPRSAFIRTNKQDKEVCYYQNEDYISMTTKEEDKQSNYFQDKNHIKMTTDDTTYFQDADHIKMKTNMFSVDADSIDMTSSGNTNMTAGGNINERASAINLN